MNEHFKELLQLLRQHQLPELEEQDLVGALQVLAVPRSLEAVVPVARHFFELADSYLELVDHPMIEDFDSKLEILRAISQLAEGVPEHFKQSRQREDSLTPLYGFTGDGPACDLLLFLAGDEKLEAEYEKLIAWFVFQCIRFEHKFLDAEKYYAYLKDESGKNRLVRNTNGGRLAAASRYIRFLGGSANAQTLETFMSLGIEISEQSSRALALLFLIAQKKQETSGLKSQDLLIHEDIDETELERRFEFAKNSVDAALRRVLTSLWEPKHDRRQQGGGGGRRRDIKKSHEIGKLRRYGDASFWGREIEVDGEPGILGTVHTDFSDDGEGKLETDEPEVRAPGVELFLGERDDWIKAHHSARAVRSVQEYDAAQLPFSKHRVSEVGIQSLRESCRPESEDTPRRLAGKALLALSMLSGRTYESCRKFQIHESGTSSDYLYPYYTADIDDSIPQVQVFLEDQMLVVMAAEPDLKKPVDPGLKRFLSEQAHFIRLRIPSEFLSIFEACVRAGFTSGSHRRGHVKVAGQLIKELSDELAVTSKGIPQILVRHLLEQSRGDLGLVKAVTDAAGLNLQNIIHYASYQAEDVEHQWHTAVSAMLDLELVPKDLPVIKEGCHIGSPYRFLSEKIADAIEDLKKRFKAHVDKKDSLRAYNCLTLYTVLWLNLACCSRSSVSPAPNAIANHAWALIQDKSREGGSTDRYLPLTPAVRAHLRFYFDYVWNLALTEPELQPLSEEINAGILNFKWYKKDKGLIQFQPMHLEAEFASLIQLPGNWARKFVRANFGDMPGRYIDAGLGHWVDGRNPWRFTSTLDCQDFMAQWLAMQTRFEKELGLEPLTFPGIEPSEVLWPRAELSNPLLEKKNGQVKDKQNKQTALDIEELKTFDGDIFKLIEKQVAESEGEADKNLVVELAIRYLVKQEEQDLPALEKLADSVCACIRKHWKVPVYRVIPPPVMRADWQQNAAAFQNLAFLEGGFLSKFMADLRRLPETGSDKQGQLVELGRCIAIGIWLLDLHSKSALDGFLDAYCRSPILATGDARYLQIKVEVELQKSIARRTVFMDAYSCSYLLEGRERLRKHIQSNRSDRPGRRLAYYGKALNAYLNSLGIDNLGRYGLQIMMQAANQKLMFDTSPIVSAYARCAFATHDLPDVELRRLNGLAPRQPFAGQMGDGGAKGDESQGESEDPSKGEAPDNLIREIHSVQTARPSEMRRRIRNIKARTKLEQLIVEFSLWLLQTDEFAKYEKNKELAWKHGKKLPGRSKQRFKHFLRVVGYSLYLLLDGEDQEVVLDDLLLEELYEFSRALYPDVNVIPAWNEFRTWLRDKTCVAASLGFSTGPVSATLEYTIDARVIHPCQMQSIEQGLSSVRSGMADLLARQESIRVAYLMQVYGLRRIEAIRLRVCELQGSVIRVQAYGEHTLKTRHSERNLPVVLIEQEGFDLLSGIDGKDAEDLLIACRSNASPDDLFFDRFNKVVQLTGHSRSLHSHHFRHAVATAHLLSFFLLAMQSERVSHSFPWMEGFLVNSKKIDYLLGSERNAGQGMQAVSALLGHAHPTTTLKHYCHGLGLLTFATRPEWKRLSLCYAFERRIKRSTYQRWVASAKPHKGQDLDLTITAHMEARFSQHLSIDETGLVQPQTEEETLVEGAKFSFDELERLDSNLRARTYDIDEDVLASLRPELAELSKLVTGKWGSDAYRHKMRRQNGEDFPEYEEGLPIPLPTGTPVECAERLCLFLARLEVEDSKAFVFLLRKLIYAADQRGRIRLDSDGELEMLKAIPWPTSMRVSIDKPKVSQARQHTGADPKFRGQIQFLDKGGKIMPRGATAIGWVILYLEALRKNDWPEF